MLAGESSDFPLASEMKITEKTYVSEILNEYGDIAKIMEIFGVRRVGGYGMRRFITVKTAAYVQLVLPAGARYVPPEC